MKKPESQNESQEKNYWTCLIWLLVSKIYLQIKLRKKVKSWIIIKSFTGYLLVAGSTNNWWLRSANSSNNFWYVNNNGNANNNNANNSNGVVLGFYAVSQSICMKSELYRRSKWPSLWVNKQADKVNRTLFAWTVITLTVFMVAFYVSLYAYIIK